MHEAMVGDISTEIMRGGPSLCGTCTTPNSVLLEPALFGERGNGALAQGDDSLIPRHEPSSD
jgi:hypothetical protein